MSVVNQIQYGLSEDQLEMARIIESEFDKAGIPSEITAGSMVNVWYESKFDPNAIGDGGKAVGLFQLHEDGGGAGMTVEERQDPHLNAQRMIEELIDAGRGYLSSSKGDGVFDIYEDGEKRVSEYAARFCRDIERPADQNACWTSRGEAAKVWYADDSIRRSLPDLLTPRVLTSTLAGTPWRRLIWGSVAVLAVGSIAAWGYSEYERQ